MDESVKLKVVSNKSHHCFATVPQSLREKLRSHSKNSHSFVLKIKWESPEIKTTFIGCRVDRSCKTGCISIPISLLHCINLNENIVITVSCVTNATAHQTTQAYNYVKLEPVLCKSFFFFDFFFLHYPCTKQK